jgi:hypothetical protein
MGGVMRNFGLSSVTSPATSGGDRQSQGSHYSAETRADPHPLPCGSILSSGPTFERGDFSQALIDVGAAFVIFLLLTVLCVSISLAIFVMLFV